MPTTHMSIDVHDHGIVVDEHKKRVKCKYCSKEVTGYTRLKQHLGCVRGDVVPCEKVPEDLKMHLNACLLERKNTTLKREVVQLFQSDTPRKGMAATSNANMLKRTQQEPSQPTTAKKRKELVVDSVLEESLVENKSASPRVVLESEHASNSVKVEKDSVTLLKKCIARFFYENNVDFSVAKSPTFSKMVDAIIACGCSGFEIPSCNELNSCIQDELGDIHRYVKEVRQSWRDTGCSILLDGWINEGHSLMNILVDCPKGPIFLKSADTSGCDENVEAMMSLLDGVIEDIGAENVIQVITYCKSDFMVALGQRFVEKYRAIFWSVCASNCVNLMLEKIAAMGSIEGVMTKAKTITEFIYSDETLLRLLKKHTQGRDLKIFSRIKTTIPFLTLEKLVFEMENIRSLFVSSAWKSSNWARTTTGRRVAYLVEDSSFWVDARMALNSIIPLVRCLNLISGGGKKPQVPYIYETMDQVKETIKEEFRNKKAQYMPFWETIDEIWNNILHSPLHTAGHFLNPSLFYSIDFHGDEEVFSGLLCCVVRMTGNQQKQDLMSLQLEDYRAGEGVFAVRRAVDDRVKIPPAEWWSLYGKQCPELQRFAIRILSQTCSGPSVYDLDRSLSERRHKALSSSADVEKLNDQVLVPYNLCLQHSAFADRRENGVACGTIKKKGGRVRQKKSRLTHDDSAWSESDEAVIHRGIASSFEPKEEPS